MRRREIEDFAGVEIGLSSSPRFQRQRSEHRRIDDDCTQRVSFGKKGRVIATQRTADESGRAVREALASFDNRAFDQGDRAARNVRKLFAPESLSEAECAHSSLKALCFV